MAGKVDTFCHQKNRFSKDPPTRDQIWIALPSKSESGKGGCDTRGLGSSEWDGEESGSGVAGAGKAKRYVWPPAFLVTSIALIARKAIVYPCHT
jgi:hypothetical protein